MINITRKWYGPFEASRSLQNYRNCHLSPKNFSYSSVFRRYFDVSLKI